MRSSRSCPALLGLGFALYALAACGDDTSATDATDMSDAGAETDIAATELDLEGPWESFEQRPCPPDSIVTWENFGGALVLAHCTGCHGRAREGTERSGAPAEIIFDDPVSIRMFDERIWSRAGDHNTSMPPVGGPDPMDRALFGEWLACGTPMQRDLNP